MDCETINIKWRRGTVKISYTAGWDCCWDNGLYSEYNVIIKSANWAFDIYKTIDLDYWHDDFKKIIKGNICKR